MRRTAVLAPAVLLGLIAGVVPVLAQPAAAAVPEAPEVSAVALSGGPAIVWTQSMGDPRSHRVYRQEQDEWVPMGEVAASLDMLNPRRFLDPDLAPGASATYAVSSVNADGEGPRSESISVTRSLVVPVPGPVDALAVDAHGSFAESFDTSRGDWVSAYRVHGQAEVGASRPEGSSPPGTSPTSAQVGISYVPGPGTYLVGPGAGAVRASVGTGSGACQLTAGTVTVREALYDDASLAPAVFDGDVVGSCGEHAVAASVRWHATTGYRSARMSATELQLSAARGQSQTKRVGVTNTGTLPLQVGPARLLSLGGQSTSGDLTTASTCNEPVPAGGTCAVDVTFSPSGAGAREVLVLPVDALVGERRVLVNAATIPLPDAPTGLTVTPVVRRNGLVWTRPYNVDETRITGYRIYRSVDGAPGAPVADVTGTSWVDADVTPGRGYLYAVAALTAAGEGPVSGLAATTGAEQSVVLVSGGAGGLYETSTVGGPRVPLDVDGLDHAHPAVSPDGLSAVYAKQSASGGQYDLWIRRLDGSSSARRLTSGPYDEFDPAWSPDGRTIAFTSAYLQGSIVTVNTVPASGGTEKLLTGDVSDPTWLPDGKTLIATQQSQQRLVRIAANGALTPVPGGAGGFMPAVSPLGDTLVFVRTDQQRQRLLRMPVTGGTPVAEPSTDDWYEPSWSPDGTSVLAEVESTTSTSGIVRVPLVGAGFGARAVITPSFWWLDELHFEPVVGGARVFLGAPVVRAGTASVAVAAPAGTLASCSLDGTAYTACGATWSRGGLRTGTHTLRVSAAGPGRPTSVASVAFDVDATPPTLVFATVPALTLTPKLRVAWRGSDASGVASYDVRYRRAARGGTYSAYTVPAGWAGSALNYRDLPVAPGYEYCVSVRARDTQGNTSAWSTDRCSAAPADDRSLAQVGGWTRPAGAAYYRGTATAVSKKGARLTLAGVSARRVKLLASTCSTCGAVQVVLGGKLLGTVSLKRAGATRHRVAIELPALPAARSGSLVLTTTSAAHVRIDGVGLRK